MPATVLPYSGGLDSTTLLWELLKRGGHVHAVFLDHGHLARDRELQAVERILVQARALLRPGQTLNLTKVAISGLPRIPESDRRSGFADHGLQILTVAAAVATTVKAQQIALPLTMSTAHGLHESLPLLAALVHKFSWRGMVDGVALSLPYQEKSKADIVARGARLGLPMTLTWSCLLGGERHCGNCRSCKARQWAFRDAHLPDSVCYGSELTMGPSGANFF